jgi:hypothetical protein
MNSGIISPRQSGKALMQTGRAPISPAHKGERPSRSVRGLQHDRLQKLVQCHCLIRWLLTPLLCLLFVAFPAHVAAQITSVIGGTIGDSQGRTITGAEVILTGSLLVREIKALSDSTGSYRLAGLQPGTYQLHVTKSGFAVQVYEGLVVTVNRILTFDVALAVSAIQAEVTISSDLPLIDTASSSSGTTILPQQIEEMPINGRNYLDLLQLVPGVALKRQVDPGTDAAVPILGERSGNAVFLIDGMPNSNAVDGVTSSRHRIPMWTCVSPSASPSQKRCGRNSSSSFSICSIEPTRLRCSNFRTFQYQWARPYRVFRDEKDR